MAYGHPGFGGSPSLSILSGFAQGEVQRRREEQERQRLAEEMMLRQRAEARLQQSLEQQIAEAQQRGEDADLDRALRERQVTGEETHRERTFGLERDKFSYEREVKDPREWALERERIAQSGAGTALGYANLGQRQLEYEEEQADEEIDRIADQRIAYAGGNVEMALRSFPTWARSVMTAAQMGGAPVNESDLQKIHAALQRKAVEKERFEYHYRDRPRAGDDELSLEDIMRLGAQRGP